MTDFFRLTPKKIFKLALAAVVILLLVLAFYAFKLLVKVNGNIKYLYNYTVETQGSKPETYNPDALAGADAETAYCTENTNPSNFVMQTYVSVGGKLVESYERTEKISFTKDFLENFTSYEGMITFRGDYMRNMQAYGSVELPEAEIDEEYWSYSTGKLLKSDGVNYWSGNGWTGQPLAVRWDEETKQSMNLFEAAKQKQDLVELIYTGMDGYIHFLDMETGEETRDAINVGMTFKGSASMHPEAPLLVCGSGDAQTGVFGEYVSARIFIYNLITGEKLYEYEEGEDFAPRNWHAYDSSPVFSPETDTLIYPGENGVVYSFKLNLAYDKASGELAINPDEPVKFTYEAVTAAERIYAGEGGYGSEASAVVYDNYLFLGDNGGIFYCLDLNTMSFVWVQDLLEDVNSSPVFEIDGNGNKFIYVATTLKYHTDEHYLGDAVIYKLNAMTGEIIWQKPYEVHTVSGLAGGVLSTGVLGKGKISDLVIYSVSKVPEIDSGYIVALDKETGKEVWRTGLDYYSWSSTSVLYDISGKVYLVQCCQDGNILLLDAENGEILDKLNFGTAIEATPAVYGNMLAVGTRNEKIIGLKIK